MRPCMRGDMHQYAAQRRAAIFQPGNRKGWETMNAAIREMAGGMIRATLTDAGVVGERADSIVGGLLDELFPIDAQPVEIIAQEEPTVDFNDLVATVKVRQ